ncbi:MAG: hypothetical protein D8H92_12790 [Campylobacter sp.]|nr:MAG: hypothetical protein D8H92_12790 [Campylobacter sp.]
MKNGAKKVKAFTPFCFWRFFSTIFGFSNLSPKFKQKAPMAIFKAKFYDGKSLKFDAIRSSVSPHLGSA